MTKEALKLALETLEYAGPSWIDARQPAITAIKEALAQREQDGECKYCIDGCPACDARKLQEQDVGITRYADISVGEIIHNSSPPQRTWVGLTRTELIRCGVLPFGLSYELYEAIEAKLKEKNT